MAKKSVTTFRTGDSRSYSRVVRMVKSPRTDAHTFQKEMVPNDHVQGFLKK